MSEFNPRESSPIKMPEQKCCPTCGQKIAGDVKPLDSKMSQYLEPITGKTMIINGSKDVLELPTTDKKGTYKVYRVTGKDSEGKSVSEFAPKAPAQETKTVVDPNKK